MSRVLVTSNNGGSETLLEVMSREPPSLSPPPLSLAFGPERESEGATDEILQRILKKKEMAGYQYPV